MANRFVTLIGCFTVHFSKHFEPYLMMNKFTIVNTDNTCEGIVNGQRVIPISISGENLICEIIETNQKITIPLNECDFGEINPHDAVHGIDMDAFTVSFNLEDMIKDSRCILYAEPLKAKCPGEDMRLMLFLHDENVEKWTKYIRDACARASGVHPDDIIVWKTV